MKRRLTLKDLYQDYPYKDDKESKYYMDEITYRNLNEDYYSLLYSYLISTGEWYKLPYGLGELGIRKRKHSGVRVDFARTKQYNNKIYHSNMHSNGYYARYKWDKRKVYIHYKNLYKFNPIRWAKRYLSSQIKDKNTIIHYTQ